MCLCVRLCPSICLSVCLSCMSAFLSMCLCVCLSVCLPVYIFPLEFSVSGIYQYFPLSQSLSPCKCMHPCVCAICMCVCVCVCVCISVSTSVCLYIRVHFPSDSFPDQYISLQNSRRRLKPSRYLDLVTCSGVRPIQRHLAYA